MVDLNSNDDHRNQLITAMSMGNNDECGSEMKFEVESLEIQEGRREHEISEMERAREIEIRRREKLRLKFERH